MSAAWWFQAVDQMATGAADRDDVWFEMSRKDQSSPAFRHVEAALSRLAPPTAQKRAEEPSPVKGGGCFGLAMLVLVVGAGSVAWWLV
jgi:ferric-dicitrate binding protein FerR (iron transport regulator)